MIEGEDYIKVKKTFLEGNEQIQRITTMVLLFEDVVYPEEYTGDLLNVEELGEITIVHFGNDDCCIMMNFDEFVEMWMNWRTKFNDKLEKRLDAREEK